MNGIPTEVLNEKRTDFKIKYHWRALWVVASSLSETPAHTVWNLHFLSKNSTLTPREKSWFFWMKNSWKCCGLGLFSCWQLWFHTLFENYSKCRILIFGILAFSTNFCPIKTDLSGKTVWPQASSFQKLAKMDHFWHF